MAPQTISEPPSHTSFLLSYPSPSILLITINRPRAMNSIPTLAHWEADALFSWFDEEPSLLVAIITGSGSKAFCAGQDLIEQHSIRQNPVSPGMRRHPPSGFCGLSRRTGKKPVIAAVNGFALGGGFEICLNCDMIVASPHATFGLPETAVGLYAAAGGLPRLVRNCGLPLASEIAMTGRRLSAQEALDFNLINKISQTPDSVVDEAIAMAQKIVAQSPDGIVVTRAALREAWETGSVERATQLVAERYEKELFTGENMRIGLKAFATKSKPGWVPSKM